MAKDPACEGERSPGYLIHWAARLFLRRVDRELRPYGVSAAQLPHLLVLAERGPLLQRDLVRLCALEQPALVATLARMERDGLITRKVHEEDRRSALIHLTTKGRKVVRAAGPIFHAINAELLGGFTSGQHQALTDALDRVIDNLGSDA